MERPMRAFPLSFQTTSNQSDTHAMYIEFSTAGRTETTPVVPYHGQLVIADALYCLYDTAGAAETDALTAQITEAIRRGERAGHGQVVGRPYAWRILEQQTPEEQEEPAQTRAQRLATFAEQVLVLLQEDGEWGGDIREVTELAQEHGLAEINADGFIRKP